MIDLHVHTNYSDGTWDLKKIVRRSGKSKNRGIIYYRP